MNDHSFSQKAIEAHRLWQGKIEVNSRVPVDSMDALSIAYTPGVAAPCLEIKDDVNKSYDYTRRWNMCLVVTDGSAVLGLGDIGPEAAMPVMEGKCVLFKAFGDVDAFPLCIKSQDVDDIVRTIYLLSGSFGGINLEDIAAPRCFEIERRLKELCDIPVFHDDQHGTAVVVLAALLNAVKLTEKTKEKTRVVFSGAGAASIAVAQLLLEAGFKNLALCDRHGLLYPGRPKGMNEEKTRIAQIINPEGHQGDLSHALKGADVFIGLSAAGLLTGEMVEAMAKDPIIFACANPDPEIDPEIAHEKGAYIVATGRSDYPNQINNVLAFPSIFRGAFDARASKINEKMKMAAAHALADILEADELSVTRILPDAMDPRIRETVARAVFEAAVETGVSRI
ncbi:MAG: NADP-dependent malic enzyme [Clostridiales bacterium]|jgi:malate dehydrogenase (oxaloacetate-decarboxylating)|nr:NADP-dependent malic enzyme [Clostridiales bacterium]MCK9349895.1 NADP-dependent malic enzyme [Clostridiales bacterium]MDD3540659.1 NADP-dependent malic enzyme [Eubacteriales bacterium]MDY0119926.1 NADP-dependent malic enzyme [Clostridia bacterium]